MEDNKTPSKYCPAPGNLIAVDPQGWVSPCCAYSNHSYRIQDLNLSEKDLFALFNDDQKTLTQGKVPTGCVQCFRQEENGMMSRRLKIIENFKSHYEPYDSYHKNRAEVCLSRACNLNCMMCNSLFSTKWTHTHKELSQDAKNSFLKSYHQSFTQNEIQYDLSPTQTQELASTLNKVKHIEILGGEPLIHKQLPIFLDQLLNNPEPPASIEITTNLTKLNPQLLDLMQPSQKTQFIFTFSIDHTYENYQYIRGFPFDKLQDNLLKINQLRTTQLLINPTYGLLNLSSYIDIVQWLQHLGINDYRISPWSFLSFDEPLSLVSATLEYRHLHIDRLLKAPCYKDHKNAIDTIVDLIESFPPFDKTKSEAALETLQFFNKKRNLSIFNLRPDLAKNFSL